MLLLLLIVSSGAAVAEANLTASGPADTALTVTVGGPFRFTTSVINNGSAAAVPFFVRFRFSRDNAYDQDTDVVIGDDVDVAAGLAPGATIAIDYQSTCPNLPAGVYFVVWRIDSGAEVTESNEDDNYFTFPTQVIVVTNTPGTTPVIASGPTADPALAFAGQPVSFSVSATGNPGVVLRYTWLFGDDVRSIESEPVHAYLDDGTYTVRVLVSDGTYGSTGETTVTIGGTPTELQANDFFQQRLEMNADGIVQGLIEAGAAEYFEVTTISDNELEGASLLTDTLLAEINDPKGMAIYGKKVPQIQTALAKLKKFILLCRTQIVPLRALRTSKGNLKAQKLILSTTKLAVKTNKTLFKALPKTNPGTGGATACPGFIIEETGSSAGLHFAGDIVNFKISTVGNAPWPADAEVRIIDNASVFGETSNNAGGFSQKPPPKKLTLTMGPELGSSRIEVRCGKKLPKSRLIFNKGAKPVKTPPGGGGGGGGPFDGTYTITQTFCVNATRAAGQGPTPDCRTGTAVMTVNGNVVSDGLFLSGTVDASGVFTGVYADPSFVQASVTGTFSNTARFVLQKQPVIPDNQVGYNVKYECTKN